MSEKGRLERSEERRKKEGRSAERTTSKSKRKERKPQIQVPVWIQVKPKRHAENIQTRASHPSRPNTIHVRWLRRVRGSYGLVPINLPGYGYRSTLLDSLDCVWFIHSLLVAWFAGCCALAARLGTTGCGT